MRNYLKLGTIHWTKNIDIASPRRSRKWYVEVGAERGEGGKYGGLYLTYIWFDTKYRIRLYTFESYILKTREYDLEDILYIS